MISRFFKKIIKKSTFLWNLHYNIKFYIEYFIAKILKRKIILSRSACLGQELFQIVSMGKKTLFISQQKMRFDLFLDQIKTKNKIMDGLVRKYLTNDSFLFPFIQEQTFLHWLSIKSDISFFMIDSFSELVDKKFTNKKEGWSFCCYGSDVNQTEGFKEDFESFGLIRVEDLDKTYRSFFNWFELKYPKKQIFFIHYPTILDGRPLYVERGKKILEIMKEIAKEKKYIHNICVDDSMVDWTEDDIKHMYPYHYSKKTVGEFIIKWKEINKKISFEI